MSRECVDKVFRDGVLLFRVGVLPGLIEGAEGGEHVC